MEQDPAYHDHSGPAAGSPALIMEVHTGIGINQSGSKMTCTQSVEIRIIEFFVEKNNLIR
jgi:hypothetical protein